MLCVLRVCLLRLILSSWFYNIGFILSLASSVLSESCAFLNFWLIFLLVCLHQDIHCLGLLCLFLGLTSTPPYLPPFSLQSFLTSTDRLLWKLSLVQLTQLYTLEEANTLLRKVKLDNVELVPRLKGWRDKDRAVIGRYQWTAGRQLAKTYLETGQFPKVIWFCLYLSFILSCFLLLSCLCLLGSRLWLVFCCLVLFSYFVCFFCFGVLLSCSLCSLLPTSPTPPLFCSIVFLPLNPSQR